MITNFKDSEQLLINASTIIPLGTQTFSKSYTQFPRGASPFYIERGEGPYVWDIDNNKYIDMINSLASITLGYADPFINQAISNQLAKGTIFSLASPLEYELSKKLVQHIPCAEMVRFGKNGSDATSAAIRLARAFTQKSHILVCGYHGWHDWYITTTTKDAGVPIEVNQLTSTFRYNDLNSLISNFEKQKGKVAAVIMEPMNIHFPEAGYLQAVKNICHENDAVLIFDETVTGFRYGLGGAQEYFDVTPDLATFGKGLANGMPLSAVVGKREIMTLFEDIFCSFTFGGETLSIAAAIAVINQLEKENILAKISNTGDYLINRVKLLVDKYQLTDHLRTSGHPSWSFILFCNPDPDINNSLKTLFIQETIKRGLLTLGSHNLTAAHDRSIIDTVLSIYDEVFGVLSRAVNSRNISSYLTVEPLKPLFNIRNND